MTGEQKPGGLEVVAWLETQRHTGEIRVALKRRADSPIMVSRWATIPLTPAEPAEARIRDLEAEVQRWFSAYSIAHDQATENGGRATAAEAKLARAARILRNANLHEATRIVDALEALQQGTQDQ